MKRNVRKIFAAVVFSLAGAFSLGALDFGGTFFNTSRLYTNDWDPVALSQQDGLTAWLKAPLSKDGKIYLATEGTALFKFSVSNLSNFGAGKPSFYLDLGLLKIGYLLNVGDSLLQLNAGRFFMDDMSGLVFSQTSDGASASFTTNRFVASAFAAYTGLTNAHFVSMTDDVSVDSDSIYSCSSPYLVAGAGVSLPYLFANQTLGAEFFAAIGANGPSGSNSGNVRSYVTLALNGPVVKELFYEFSTTFGFKDGVSNLSSFKLSYYPPLMDSAVNFSLLYASGENGGIKPFRTVTKGSASYAYSDPDLSGVFKAGLSGSIKPLENLFVGLETGLVFDLAESFAYDGFEWALNAKYQLFTDLQLGISVLQYYDVDKYDNNSVLTLNAVIAF